MSGLVVDLLCQGERLRTVPFDRPVLRIGRMRENDIVVDHLSVSRFHARLHLDAGRVFLEDGGSENGSWVNGERVRGRVEIAPGDRIEIGQHELRVRSRRVGEVALDDAPTQPPEALRQEPEPMSDAASIDASARDAFDFASEDLAAAVAAAELAPAEPAGSPEPGDEEASETVLLAEEEVDDAPAPVAPAAAPAPAAPLHAGLIVQREGRIERVVAWEGDALTVGRSPECDLVLAQEEVSRRHARFVRNGDRYEVYDLGSVNGTLVNGRRADRHDLAVGDVIAIESFELTFVLDREPITATVKATPAQPARIPAPDPSAIARLEEEALPAAGLDGAAPVSQGPEATIANITLEEDLVAVPDGLDDPFDPLPIEERKELAVAQPRGSSRAASVQDLGPSAESAPAVVLELRLRVDQLPEPLRRTLEEAGAADLVIPADLRLRRA